MHPRLYSTEDLRERPADQPTLAEQLHRLALEQRARAAHQNIARIREVGEAYHYHQLAAAERVRAVAGRTVATFLRQLTADTRRGFLEQRTTLSPDERDRTMAEREQGADYRDWIADQRQADADRRDRIADERDQIAAERERQVQDRQRQADERERRLQEREHLVAEREREADERDRAIDDPTDKRGAHS